jgi:hypothetical protein
MPTGTQGHVVYRSRAEEDREQILRRAQQVKRERAEYAERLANAHARRWGLSLATAREHIAAVAISSLGRGIPREEHTRATVGRASPEV